MTPEGHPWTRPRARLDPSLTAGPVTTPPDDLRPASPVLPYLVLGGDLLAARVQPLSGRPTGCKARPPALRPVGRSGCPRARRAEVTAPGALPRIFERCRVRAEPAFVLARKTPGSVKR
jgi:hypothetical protein